MLVCKYAKVQPKGMTPNILTHIFFTNLPSHKDA